ncbi:uncharacterized protein KIAA1522-like [Anabas testudineus]|uniref:KIAA1522 n=1 Tax=Anabas testudineus TaxID=64144 RepID=A0A3Q1IX07_ANATE|nr:uncharacterized protein KIAA1522-like [Anabas testudineus]
MSNRDSLGFGDLLPQDVVEIFAQEKHNKRGRKKRSNSLGRALGWLKGKKRKDLSANGQRLGLGPALDLALDGHPAGNQGGHRGGQKSGRQSHLHGNSYAVPKRDGEDKILGPPLLQENVFIESSRPKYLEDLHTEALEGLKMMQQEEINTGVEFQDNESTISTVTVQTDGEGGGFTTDSTIPDTSSVVSVQSSVSTRSSRSGLTRQASTFRPLNSGKKSDKARRGRHRKTVAGIPQHVQREMGLDRVGWTLTQKLDEEQLYNGETDHSTTSDRPQRTARSPGTSAGLRGIKIMQPLKKNQIEQLGAPRAGHRDDLALLHRLGPDLSGEQRPRSLAVPWMTTDNSPQQELPSPVMSMSPQAAYMSKIIPNAVLPPSIEVVEISRGQSRSSLRTVSKSSLLLSSPAPSRASSRASSSRTRSSRASTITSASRYNPPNVSDSSCWSNSDSDTLVSDSSTISSSSTPRQKRSQDGDASAREDKVSVHSSVSKASKCTSNGKVISKEDKDERKKEGQFVRSLSVMKPKRAPPPPSRSYSLHNKTKRRSRDLAEIRVKSGESPLKSSSGEGNENKSQYPPKIDSPSYHADTSSLDDSTGSGSFSPFKSQLQALKEEKAAKVEEMASKDAPHEKQDYKLSKVISPSSGYSSQDALSPYSSSPKHKKGLLAKLQKLFPASTSAGSAPSPEKTKSTGDPKLDSVDTVTVNPAVRTLRDLFNIPPPPKVHAPPPPPPEVWAYSKRSFELLLGPPAPDNLYAIIKKNPKDRRQQRQSPSASTEGSVNSLVTERKHKTPTPTVESINGSVHVLETTRVQESEIMNAENRKENMERLAQNVDLNGNAKMTEKDDKVKVSDILNGMLIKAVEKREERLAAIREEAKKTTQAADVKTNMDTLPAMSLVHISPSTSSAAVHHTLQQTTQLTSVQTVVSPASSWPPPPSPLMGQIGVRGPDEIDFPLPPPPLFGAAELVIPVQVPPERSVPGGDSSTTTSVTAVAPPSLTIPPPPPYTAPPPPLKAVSPPMTKKLSTEVFPPPPIEFAPPTSTEVSPPPPKGFAPPTSTEVSPPPPKESTLLIQEVSCPPVKDISSTLVKIVSPSPVIEISPPEVSLLPPKQSSTESSVEAIHVSQLPPPPSIPPPPPLPSQPQVADRDIEPPQENIQSKPENDPVSCSSIVTTPQSIPPPPSTELLHQPQFVPANTDSPATQEAPPSKVSVQPAPEASQQPAPPPPVNIPLPPPLPVHGLGSIKQKPSLASTENQSQQLTSVPNTTQKEEPTPIVTPSLLQMVKLRAVNSSPEPPKAQEPPQPEVIIRKKVPSSQVPTPSASGETPQKPIRKSLIMISPTSTSPPVTFTSQSALPKSQPVAVAPASSSTAPSPTKTSSSATAIPSMNLQEAIRLRTAVRSKESPASRLSLHSPTSPIDVHKSPSSTASFIFSKSNRKVVIETKPASDSTAALQKNQGVSSVSKVPSETELLKTGVKVPPPVAKKPKTKCKENETGEEVEQTAGQDGDQESNMDAAVRTNGTAGTVEEGEMAST